MKEEIEINMLNKVGIFIKYFSARRVSPTEDSVDGSPSASKVSL